MTSALVPSEPGGDPPGLFPADKAVVLKVTKEVYHPDIVDILVHDEAPISGGGRSQMGRERPPLPIF